MKSAIGIGLIDHCVKRCMHTCTQGVHAIELHGVCTVLCCAIEHTTMVVPFDSAEGNLNPQTPTARFDRIPDKDLKVWLNRRVPQ